MQTRPNQPPISHQPEPPVYNSGPNLSPVTRPDSPGHLNTSLDHHPHHSNPALQSENKNGEAATSWSKVASSGGFEVVSSGAEEEQRSSGGVPNGVPNPQQQMRQVD
eukprot:UN22437